tara:strand:- start:10806 stop:11291 length:486 start_codon:yes stop_codon:yes gene_type:complete
MATTISSTATVNMQANDGAANRAASWELNDFNNLAVPSNATILGIELLMDMGGTNLTNGGAYFKVNNGTSDSSAKAPTTNFTAYNTFSDMTVGAADDLWGLEWTPATANNITAKWDVNYHSGGTTAYFDHVQIRITFRELVGGKITLSSGRIVINKGKIVL